MFIVDFLNQNSGAILGITTLVYAIITGRMLYETKKMREFQTEPHVFINIQHVEGARFLLNMVIQNIGPGPAYNLTFKLDPDIELRSGRKLSEINLMKQGFKYLAPNQRLECIVANSIEEARKNEKIVYAVTVQYQNKKKKSFTETFVLDFTEYFGLLYNEADSYKKIVEKLDAIHHDIAKVTGGISSKIRVVAYTRRETEEEEKKYLCDEIDEESEKKQTVK